MSHAAADPPGVPPRRLPAVEERSAGGVVVDVHEGEARIAVIARRNRAGRVEWCLPKGHIEGEETLPQTAAREVAEETGIRAGPHRARDDRLLVRRRRAPHPQVRPPLPPRGDRGRPHHRERPRPRGDRRRVATVARRAPPPDLPERAAHRAGRLAAARGRRLSPSLPGRPLPMTTEPPAPRPATARRAADDARRRRRWTTRTTRRSSTPAARRSPPRRARAPPGRARASGGPGRSWPRARWSAGCSGWCGPPCSPASSAPPATRPTPSPRRTRCRTTFYLLIAGGAVNAIFVPQIVRAKLRPDGDEFVNRIITLSLALLAGGDGGP